MSTYIRDKNTAVLKTNGIVWRSVRNRFRFPDIYICSRPIYCQCHQFDDSLATAIRHCTCAMFTARSLSLD